MKNNYVRDINTAPIEIDKVKTTDIVYKRVNSVTKGTYILWCFEAEYEGCKYYYTR